MKTTTPSSKEELQHYFVTLEWLIVMTLLVFGTLFFTPTFLSWAITDNMFELPIHDTQSMPVFWLFIYMLFTLCPVIYLDYRESHMSKHRKIARFCSIVIPAIAVLCLVSGTIFLMYYVDSGMTADTLAAHGTWAITFGLIILLSWWHGYQHCKSLKKSA